MKLIYFLFNVIIFLFLINPIYGRNNLTGAGATFPVPIYVSWADKYQKETGNKINYQGIGSFAGIKQIIVNTIDFAASDVFLEKSKAEKEKLFQFPILIGGIVPAINIPNIRSGELILNSEILSDIYFGNITHWNDKKIIKLNPNLNIPNKEIIVIHRTDNSGTTYVFTQYLSKSNFFWKKKIGFGSIINWPTGIGVKGNEGVATFVQHVSGSIGYVEYSYIKQSKLSYAKLISASGEIVDPNELSFKSAVKNFDFNKDFINSLINQKGKNVWPITSTTFIILKRNQKNIKKIKEVFKFFDWAYTNGINESSSLGYAMLPKRIIQNIKICWKKDILKIN